MTGRFAPLRVVRRHAPTPAQTSWTRGRLGTPLPDGSPVEAIDAATLTALLARLRAARWHPLGAAALIIDAPWKEDPPMKTDYDHQPDPNEPERDETGTDTATMID